MCSSERQEKEFENKRVCFRFGFGFSVFLSLYVFQLIDAAPWKLAGSDRHFKIVMGFLPLFPLIMTHLFTAFISFLDMLIVRPFKSLRDAAVMMIGFVFWFPFAVIAYFVFDIIAAIW